jgi:ABC-type branched-subunit amino acid transport system substrate-binding protein
VQSDPLKIGVLFSQKGAMDVSECAHLQGILLACAEINAAGGIGGRQLTPVILDPQGDDKRYAELATDLLLKHRVNAIFGCCLSSSRKAVLPVIERFNGILFYPSVYEGFEYSPNVVYGGAVPNQLVLPLLEYLFATQGRRIALVGSDTLYAREINRIVKEFLAESSGISVLERYLPFSATTEDFLQAAKLVQSQGADAVLSTVVGRSSIAFYEAYAEITGPASLAPIASLTTTESELAQMRPEARLGHLAVAPYFGTLATVANKSFVNLFHGKYGSAGPGVYSEVAYSLVHFYANALELAGAADTDTILGALSGAVFKAPGGDVQIDTETNHCSIRPLIGKANLAGQYDIVWQSPTVIRADPYLIAYDRSVSKMIAS